MKTKILLALLILAVNPAFAKPPADDSVHGGTGRQLLDNITPKSLGSSSGGGRWTGYDHLKGRQLDTGFDGGYMSMGTSTGYRLQVRCMAMVDGNGIPYYRSLSISTKVGNFIGPNSESKDTGWLPGEGGNELSLSPRGLTCPGNKSVQIIAW